MYGVITFCAYTVTFGTVIMYFEIFISTFFLMQNWVSKKKIKKKKQPMFFEILGQSEKGKQTFIIFF